MTTRAMPVVRVVGGEGAVAVVVVGRVWGSGEGFCSPPKPGVLRINAANQKGMWR